MRKRKKKSWVSEFDMNEVEQASSEWDMPRLREPDFSDVRKKIFNPVKVIIFVVMSIIFWYLMFKFM